MALVFRQATAAEAPSIRTVFGSEPSDEQVGMAGGDRSKATRFRKLMTGSLTGPGPLSRTVVALNGNGVVGFAQVGEEAGDRVSPSIAWGVLCIFGIRGIRGFLRRDRARDRVHIPAPIGAYHIAELHVDANRRNQGIGAALLAEAERIARAQGFRVISLTTTTSNPARHLYERSGFAVTETRTDPEYRALTGIDGRVLMVKRLE